MLCIVPPNPLWIGGGGGTWDMICKCGDDGQRTRIRECVCVPDCARHEKQHIWRTTTWGGQSAVTLWCVVFSSHTKKNMYAEMQIAEVVCVCGFVCDVWWGRLLSAVLLLLWCDLHEQTETKQQRTIIIAQYSCWKKCVVKSDINIGRLVGGGLYKYCECFWLSLNSLALSLYINMLWYIHRFKTGLDNYIYPYINTCRYMYGV